MILLAQASADVYDLVYEFLFAKIPLDLAIYAAGPPGITCGSGDRDGVFRYASELVTKPYPLAFRAATQRCWLPGRPRAHDFHCPALPA